MAQLNVDGDVRPLFDGVFADEPRVGSSAARENDDAINRGKDFYIDSVNVNSIVFDAAKNGVRHRSRFFTDFFGHERTPSTLARCGGVPRDLKRLGLDRISVEVDDRNVLTRNGDDLVLPDGESFVGELDERRNIAAQEVLAVAKANDER